MKHECPEGLDLVDVQPRFGEETKEEYWGRYRQRYFEVYGEYPETPLELRKNESGKTKQGTYDI